MRRFLIFCLLFMIFISILSVYINATGEGSIEDFSQPLNLNDNKAPDYANIDFAPVGDAYNYYRGSLNVVSDGTPEAKIDIHPDEFLWDKTKGKYHCIKTFVLDLERCEKAGGSLEEGKEFNFIVTQERLFRHLERPYTYTSETGAIARCSKMSDKIGYKQEVMVVVNPNKFSLLATKPAYRCSNYATKEACKDVKPNCEWNDEENKCEFVPNDDFDNENQVKYWFLENENCFIADINECEESKKWDIVNDLVYKALIEHYHNDDYDSSSAPIPGVFYHIKNFLNSDLVFATFFEKWAKFYIKELGGMDESERIYSYKTDLNKAPVSYDFSYPTYSFRGLNDIFIIDGSYISDANIWNKFQYINEMPDKDIVEFKGPVGSFKEPVAGEMVTYYLWKGIWTKIFTVTPELLNVTQNWTRTGNMSFYAGSGQDRTDACEFSCKNGEECNLLKKCKPYDPMDNDATQYEHCHGTEKKYDLCKGFVPCSIVRGFDGCPNDEYAPCTCNNDMGDCWGDLGEECKIVAQYKLMWDEPPEECKDAGFGTGGFEKYQVIFYTREWSDCISHWPCDDCDLGMKKTPEERKRIAPGPECKTKWILEGGLKGITTFEIPHSKVKGLPEGDLEGVRGLKVKKIADNIWEIEYDIDETMPLPKPKRIKTYKIKIIDTGNVPFDVTCAYLEKEGDTYTITRYYKTTMGRWTRLTIDSDIDFNFELKGDAKKLDINVNHKYRTGLREDKFYLACDRLSCSCCCNPGEYKFCLAGEMRGYHSEEHCGGVSEKVVCRGCSIFGCIGCSEFREEIKTYYREIETPWISDKYTIENVEKDDWKYSDGTDDKRIRYRLTFDATRYKEGNIMGTKGFVNLSISPDFFRGMTMVAADSQIDYHKLLSPVIHELWKKKSTHGPNRINYTIEDKYGYDSNEFYFPEQCRKICPVPPECVCSPDDITKPLCMKKSEVEYDDDIEDILCEHFYPDMDTDKCKKDITQGDIHVIKSLCDKYLEEIKLPECEFNHDRVYCYNKFKDDELYMKCYLKPYFYWRDDCVCTPNDCYENPCKSKRNFHEEEGSIIVNGDFEMGFEPEDRNKLGPWEVEDGNAEVVWMGRNGYALKISKGATVKQKIPLDVYHRFKDNDERNYICLEYGLLTTSYSASLASLGKSYEGKLTINISSTSDSVKYTIVECNNEECCEYRDWHLWCNKIPFDNITEIKLSSKEFTKEWINPETGLIEEYKTGFDVLIDNVNVGKYYDFVKFYNYELSGMELMDLPPTKTTGGLNRLIVTKLENGTHKENDEVWHYYTIYFRTYEEPYMDVYSGLELYDIVSRDEFENGNLTVYTFFRNYTIPLKDADIFKIRDAMDLTYSVEPYNKVILPGSNVKIMLTLFNIDKGRGEPEAKIYISSDEIDISTLNPTGLVYDEDIGEYYVITDENGKAEFTIKPNDFVCLRMKYYGSNDPTAFSNEKRICINVVTIKTTLLSPEIITLLLILIFAVFSYRFLGISRMDIKSWIEDLKGRR